MEKIDERAQILKVPKMDKNTANSQAFTCDFERESNGSGEKKRGRRGRPTGSKKKEFKFPVQPKTIQVVKTPHTVVNHSYSDFSCVPPELSCDDPNNNDNGGATEEIIFSQKLHDILSKNEYEKIIRWAPHGRSFMVLTPKPFEKVVCPHYFGHSRYSSFLRSLNDHGFKYITSGVDRNSYYHECFLKNLPHLCKYMPKRRNARRLIPDQEHEPNLYEISESFPLPATAAVATTRITTTSFSSSTTAAAAVLSASPVEVREQKQQQLKEMKDISKPPEVELLPTETADLKTQDFVGLISAAPDEGLFDPLQKPDEDNLTIMAGDPLFRGLLNQFQTTNENHITPIPPEPEDVTAFGKIDFSEGSNEDVHCILNIGTNAMAVPNIHQRQSHPPEAVSWQLSVASDSSTSEATTVQNVTNDQVQNTNKSNMGKDKLLFFVSLSYELAKKARECHIKGISFQSTAGLESECVLSERDVREELVSLGRVLYKNFTGVYPFHDSLGGSTSTKEASPLAVETISPMKRERRSTPQSHVPLRDLGFPVSLCLLVTSLMDARNDDAVDRYCTAAEVEEDLHLMTIDPERYLFDADSKKLMGHLEFPFGKLYGREQESSDLMHAFDRVIGSGGACEMVLVSGHSGTGKSSLVEQLHHPLNMRKGHFISGKFDELHQVQSMSIIFAAFNNYCNDLLGGDEKNLSLIREALNDALGPNVSVLLHLLPSLSNIVEDTNLSTVSIGGKEASNRFLFYFRIFVRTIASPSRPVILFLDDLQWADTASLRLVSMLVSDTEASSFLFAGCYRDDEVSLEHPLMEEIRNIKAAGVNVLNIKLGNIDRYSVNVLVSDALHLPPRITRSLANMVHAKTSGNPLFVVQFLRSLYDDRLLKYSASCRRWGWDVEAIQSKDIASNVVDLMTKKMSTLDSSVQYLLKVAACLGSRSEASTLKLLSLDGDNSGGSEILPFFDLAVNEGLMNKTGNCYKFSHDLIQQAAYSLIPEGDRDSLHLHIGRLLWKHTKDEKEASSLIFLIVDQLHRGFKLISSHDEMIDVASLCLTAGVKAKSSHDYMQAATCLLKGSTLLKERDWEDNYDLCLQLFTCCAEAQYATGNLDGATITVDPILKYGRTFQDKFRAYYTLLNSLGAQGKHLDAIDCGRKLLDNLGEPFPRELNRNHVMNEFGKTKAMLQATNTAKILEKYEMQDANKIAVLKISSIIGRSAFHVNQLLVSLLTFRMVQATLCFGLCGESPYAFASFGIILNSFGDYDNGYHYGKLALTLSERCGGKEYLPRLYAMTYAFFFFKMPLQSILPPLKQAHDLGLSIGDVEWAMTAAKIFSLFAIHSGSKLGPLLEKLGIYVQEMKIYKHDQLALTLPSLQAILNLTGGAQDPSVLTGEAMDQDELLNMARETQQLHVVRHICVMRMWLAYLFRKYDVAADMVETCQSIPCLLNQWIMVNDTFYSGLTAIVMAARGEESSGKWKNIAYDTLEKFEMWSAHSDWNFQHKACLLRAEIAYYWNRDLEGAGKAYSAAIRAAGEHGFVHEEALACERAGIFCSEAINVNTANGYFEEARKHYLSWGAKQKAQDLLSLMENR